MNRHSLDAAWDSGWPQTSPLASSLRLSHPERWFRIHSLPESKRYAETEMETAEVIARHHAVLEALGAARDRELVVVAPRFEDSSSPSPGAWLWRVIDEGDEETRWELFATEVPRGELDPILLLVADDQCPELMILPQDLSWIVHPYDGGADIIAPTRGVRDALRSRFSAWISKRADGL